MVSNTRPTTPTPIISIIIMSKIKFHYVQHHKSNLTHQIQHHSNKSCNNPYFPFHHRNNVPNFYNRQQRHPLFSPSPLPIDATITCPPLLQCNHQTKQIDHQLNRHQYDGSFAVNKINQVIHNFCSTT